MEGPRTVPFTADPSVVLCTEHAGTVAPFYFLNLRYGSKYGTFENRIICGANKNFFRAGFEPATSVLPYIYIYIHCKFLLLVFVEFLEPNGRFILKGNSNVRESFID